MVTPPLQVGRAKAQPEPLAYPATVTAAPYRSAAVSIRKDCRAMPTRHPFDAETSYSVNEAAAWLTENGLPTSPTSLNSMGTKGDGPAYFKIGKPVYYKVTALGNYLHSKLTPEVRSTSELRQANRLQIEDNSDKASG